MPTLTALQESAKRDHGASTYMLAPDHAQGIRQYFISSNKQGLARRERQGLPVPSTEVIKVSNKP
jgi:hypothetical protein